MFRLSFIGVELIFTAVWLLCRAAVWLRRGGIDLGREALMLLMYVNLAVIIRFTFFPMEGIVPLEVDPGGLFGRGWLKVNLVPLVNLFDYETKRDMLLNVIGNAAMFIPTGIVLPIVYKKLKSFWAVVGAGALISLCIELLQLICPTRTTDVDDLILNTVGVALGCGIYALVKCLISKIKAGRSGGEL